MNKRLEAELHDFLESRNLKFQRYEEIVRTLDEKSAEISRRRILDKTSFTDKDKQRYNITLSKDEYETLKRVAKANNITISKFIKKVISALKTSNAAFATDKFLIFIATENGAAALDVLTGTQIDEISGGTFAIKRFCDEITGEEYCVCDLSIESQKIKKEE